MKKSFILSFLLGFNSAFATIFNAYLYANTTNEDVVNGTYIGGIFRNGTLYFYLGAKEKALTFTNDDSTGLGWVSVNNTNYYLHADMYGYYYATTDILPEITVSNFTNANSYVSAYIGGGSFYTVIGYGGPRDQNNSLNRLDALDFSGTEFPWLTNMIEPQPNITKFSLIREYSGFTDSSNTDILVLGYKQTRDSKSSAIVNHLSNIFILIYLLFSIDLVLF